MSNKIYKQIDIGKFRTSDSTLLIKSYYSVTFSNLVIQVSAINGHSPSDVPFNYVDESIYKYLGKYSLINSQLFTLYNMIKDNYIGQYSFPMFTDKVKKIICYGYDGKDMNIFGYGNDVEFLLQLITNGEKTPNYYEFLSIMEIAKDIAVSNPNVYEYTYNSQTQSQQQQSNQILQTNYNQPKPNQINPINNQQINNNYQIHQNINKPQRNESNKPGINPFGFGKK